LAFGGVNMNKEESKLMDSKKAYEILLECFNPNSKVKHTYTELKQATEVMFIKSNKLDTLKEKILEEIDICKKAIKLCEFNEEKHHNLDNRLEFLNEWLKMLEGN
jgi:hypothetical protein